MPQLLSQTAKLIPYPKRLKSVASLATAYDFEPPAEQAGFGQLLIVIEVIAAAKQAEELIDLIIETTGKAYYESTDPKLTVPADRFDAAIRQVNQELAIYATQASASWVGKISAVIAIQLGDELMITETGSASGYLYRHGHGTCVTADLSTNQPHRPSKTFSNVASGPLQAGDRLLLTTPALLHAIPAAELTAIIVDNGAAAAADKCRQRLAGHESLERVAAIITALSTPEMAQVTPSSGLPRDQHLGKPESVAQAAKYNLAPLLKGLGQRADRLWRWCRRAAKERLLPWLEAATLKIIQFLRRCLASRRGRWLLGGSALAIIVLVGWLIHAAGSSAAIKRLESRYHHDYGLVTQAEADSAADPTTAKQKLQQAQSDLTALQKDHQLPALNRALHGQTHPEDDPASVAGLAAIVSSNLDKLNGLTRVTPKLLFNFATISGAKPTLMTSVGQHLIAVDSTGGSASLYSYNLMTAKIDATLTHRSSLGRVTALAAASTGDGVYLLTDKTAVWFYRLSDHSLTAQTTSGSWVAGQALASFDGNLYILATDKSNLIKYVKSSSGFAAGVNYLSGSASSLAAARSLAIDGSVYVGTTGGFDRYLSGVLQSDSVTVPANLKAVDQIVSVAGGTSLVTSDVTTNRIGIYSFDGTNAHYQNQLLLNGYTAASQLSPDPNAKVIYALADQKLLSFSF